MNRVAWSGIRLTPARRPDRALLALTCLALSATIAAAAPTILSTSTSPAGSTCSEDRRPNIILYSTSSVREVCTCKDASWSCDPFLGSATDPDSIPSLEQFISATELNSEADEEAGADGTSSQMIYVGCDYDGDPACDMEQDLNAAIESTCPGLICPDDGIVMIVEPGDYDAPAADIPGHVNGILELPANFTLECMPGAVLNGYPHTNTTARHAVVNMFTDNSTLRNCRIDGGMPDGGGIDFDGLVGPRIGVCVSNDGLSRPKNIRVIGNHVEHTRHACYYAKSAEGVWFVDNYGYECGGWDNTGSIDYPCFYIYNDDAAFPTEAVQINGNYCERSQAAAINFRKRDPSSELRHITSLSNVIKDMQDFTPALDLRGCESCSMSKIIAIDSDGVRFQSSREPQYADGQGPGASANVNGSENSNVSELLVVLDDQDTFCADIGDYHIGPTLRGLTCVGTGNPQQDGIRIRQPNRRVQIDQVSISNVGQGIVWTNDHPQNYPTHLDQDEESARISQLTLSQVDTHYLTMNIWVVVDVEIDGFYFSDGPSNVHGAIRLRNPLIADIAFRNGVVHHGNKNARLWNLIEDAARVIWDNIEIRGQSSGQHAIHAVSTAECTDCRISNILYDGRDGGGGAVQFDSPVPSQIVIDNVQCFGGHTGDCVDLAAFGSGTRIGDATGEPAWYKVHGDPNANDCPTSGVLDGSLCTDRDGAGGTDCVSGTEACFFFIRSAGAWVGHPQ